MELREQKIKILKKEFEAIDINHDELLSKEEFFRSLDLKVLKSFFFSKIIN